MTGKKFFRGDAALANPELYPFLETEGYLFAIPPRAEAANLAALTADGGIGMTAGSVKNARNCQRRPSGEVQAGNPGFSGSRQRCWQRRISFAL
jgi:hypothetical protein